MKKISKSLIASLALLTASSSFAQIPLTDGEKVFEYKQRAAISLDKLEKAYFYDIFCEISAPNASFTFPITFLFTPNLENSKPIYVDGYPLVTNQKTLKDSEYHEVAMYGVRRSSEFHESFDMYWIDGRGEPQPSYRCYAQFSSGFKKV